MSEEQWKNKDRKMEKEVQRFNLPLQPEEVTSIFLNHKTIDFEISVKGQKPKKALMFLKNLRKPITVVDYDREFLKEYMTSKHLVWAKNLAKVHANIMYFDKYGHTLFDEVLAEFDVKDCEEFVNDEKELVNAHREMLESLPLFLTVATMVGSKQVKNEKGDKVIVRDDEEAMNFIEKVIPQENIIEEATPLLGANLVQMCDLPDYLFRYVDEKDMFNMLSSKWFAKFFEDTKFDKKYFIAWLEGTSFAKNILGVYRYLDEGKYKVNEGMAVPSLGDRVKLPFANLGNKFRTKFSRP